MLARQSMARVSCASTEEDFVPAMVPFDWETVPGKPLPQPGSHLHPDHQLLRPPGFQVRSTVVHTYGPSKTNVYNWIVEPELEGASLPFPPGKGPRDGFYLPYPRPVDVSSLQSGAINSDVTSLQKKSFRLRYPGLFKNHIFRGRKRSAIDNILTSHRTRENVHSDETHAGRNSLVNIFNPVSGHWTDSRITKRILVESMKKQSLFGRCFPFKKRNPQSDIKFHNSNSLQLGHEWSRSTNADELLEERDANNTDSAPSGSSHTSCPRCEGPRIGSHACLSPVAGKPQLPSCQFIASMLMCLCLSKPDEADEAWAAALNGTAEIYGDQSSISAQLTTPTAESSSPETISKSPEKTSDYGEFVLDPSSSIKSSFKERSSSRSTSGRLWEVPDMACSSELYQTEKLVQSKRLHTDEFPVYLNCNPVAFKVPSFSPVSTEAFPGKEMATTGSRNLDRSRRSYKQSRQEEQSSASALNLDVQGSDGFESAGETFETVENDYKRNTRSYSVTRNASTGSGIYSSSSDTFSLHKFLWPPSLSVSVSKDSVPALISKPAASCIVEPLSPPWSLFGDCEYPFTTGAAIGVPSGMDHPKTPGRFRSSRTTSQPSQLRKSSLEEQSKLDYPPVTGSMSNPMHLLQKQATKSTSPLKISRAKEVAPVDRMGALQPSSAWLKPLKSFDSTNGNLEDEEGSVSDTSVYETPREDSNRSMLSPVYSVRVQKSATSVVSEKDLYASSLLRYKLQRQQSYDSPRSSFMVEDSTLHPKIEQTMIRNKSCRSSKSRVSTDHEQDLITVADSCKAPGHAAGNLSRTGSVLRKVAEWESKAGVGSSRNSMPDL